MTNYYGVVAPLSLESVARPCFQGGGLPSGSLRSGMDQGKGVKHVGITAAGFAAPWRLREDRPMTAVAPNTTIAAEPKTAQATPQGLRPISPG